GHRPIAILETRPKGEPYDHERVRPIPLYLRGAGVAWGRYQQLIEAALRLVHSLRESGAGDILVEAHFDPDLLDELALDPRAYDHGHPANRRPNYVFGEWDPYHIDNQGRYRRFVVRQHLNHYLARHRAFQMQQKHLALLFAAMGFPDASREEAARIQVASVRLLSEILGRLSLGQVLVDRGEHAGAAALLPEAEDLLRRGIACGALADPWNILGFQGLYPLFQAREDSIRDPRIDELLSAIDGLFS